MPQNINLNNDILNQEILNLESLRSQIISELSNLPKDDFICQSRGKYSKWFYKHNDQIHFLSKKNHAFALELVKAKYYRALKSDIDSSIIALQKCFSTLSSVSNVQKLLSKANYAILINEAFSKNALFLDQTDEGINEWLSANYPKNENFPEKCIHQTLCGIKVRSKSEALIANCLYNHKIPFRYEERIMLGEISCCPDFCIMHPNTHAIYYWEHFGMMDDSNYRRNAFNKMSLYADNGFILSDKLLATFESSNHPLGIIEVEDIIKERFL